MKLKSALEILKEPTSDSDEKINVFLACGFTPLHLGTFLEAELRLRFPNSRIALEHGTYGDLVGNIERLRTAKPNFGAVTLEWMDLDRRLGIRSLGGWAPKDLPDILDTVKYQGDYVVEALTRASAIAPLSVCPPTLPLPPISYVIGLQASPFELQLRQLAAEFSARLSNIPSIKVVNHQRLDLLSPSSGRLDVKSELRTGFPYKLVHASVIAELLIGLIAPPPAKKGLITDLDDTFWRGILGEVGVGGVSWDLDNHSQIHGLYQQLLGSLAGAGVLIAVASKNELDIVQEVFGRDDLLVYPDRLFPLEVGWGPKSESVRSILNSWNIGPDSIVFVDDSPMELAEVKAAHPDVECLQFPTNNEQAAYALLERLRDFFGKDTISHEDTIRMDSIRQASELHIYPKNPESQSDDFLAKANSEITANFLKEPLDPRAIDLVNKTNQFNLNGKRLHEGEWRKQLIQTESFLMIVSYQDKFGPLGKISILSGNQNGKTLNVHTWVMSCRAFSRRIEYKCLDLLFEKFGVAEIQFDYLPTDKNTPLQEFFSQFPVEVSNKRYRLTRKSFYEHCPQLFHKLKEPIVV